GRCRRAATRVFGAATRNRDVDNRSGARTRARNRRGDSAMQSTMMDVPLSLNHLLERAGQIFPRNTIVSRLPDKSLRTHTYGEYHRRTRALASALQHLGLQ